MLKLWVNSANLISYHSISKLLFQSAPAAAVKDKRLIFIVYLIILTTYFLLDVTKQLVAANPDIISQASEQPKPITQSTFAINDRCLLNLEPNFESLTQTSEVPLANGRESCRVDRQNRSNPDIALADSLAEPLLGTRRFSSLREAAPTRGFANALATPALCAYGTRIEWILTDRVFNPKILDLLKPDDLFLLPKFVPRILPPVPTDRPFIAPTTPVSPVLPPQDRDPIQLPKIKPLPTAPDPRYLIAPRLLKLEQFNPALTLIAINDVALTHRSQIEVTSIERHK